MRRLRLWIIVCVALVVLVGAFLLVLPPIVRRVVLNDLRASTGREVTLERLGLNLFTRRVTIDGLRVLDPSGPPALEFARLEARFRLWPMLRGRFHIDTAELTHPILRIVRVAPDRLNVSDIVTRMTSGGRRRLYVTLDRFALADGTMLIEDRTTTPAGRWEASGLTADLYDIQTSAETDRGRASVRFMVAGAPVSFDAEGIGLNPLQGTAHLTVGGADLAQLWAYVPARTTLQPAGGHLTATLSFALSPQLGLRTSGDATVTDLVLLRSGQREPFVTTRAVRMKARDVDLKNGVLNAANLELAGEPTIVDGTASPPQRFDLKGFQLTVTGARYPSTIPAAVVLRTGLRGGGTVDAHGTTRVDTLATHLDVALGGVDLALVPPASPITIDRGRMDATLVVDSGGGSTLRATGDFDAKELVLLRAGQSEPFVTHPLLKGHVTNLALVSGGVSVERLALSGAPTIIDSAASPPARYDFKHLSMVAEDVRWPHSHTARVDIQANVAGSGTATIQGTIDPATLTADVRVNLAGVDLKRVAAYLPASTPVKIAGGRVDGRVDLRHDRPGGARVRADLSASDLALARPEESTAFMTAPRLRLVLPRALVKGGKLQPATVRIDGAPTFVDTSVTPPRRLSLRAFHLTLSDVAWPLPGAVPIQADSDLPEAGTLEARGTIAPDTRTAALTVNVKDAALGPLRSFLPINAAVAGRAGASLDLTLAFGSTFTATARGTAEVAKLVLGDPDDPPATVDRIQAEGIDADWPSRVRLERLAVTRPVLLIAREKDGSFPLRAMLALPAAARQPRHRARTASRRRRRPR